MNVRHIIMIAVLSILLSITQAIGLIQRSVRAASRLGDESRLQVAATGHQTDLIDEKVDAKLWAELSHADAREIEFFVVFQQQADLEPAKFIEDWNERGRFVLRQLRETALSSQANASSLLHEAEKSGSVSEVRSFYIVNAIFVKGDWKTVERLVPLPEVAMIDSAPSISAPKMTVPETNLDIVTSSTVEDVEWNIARIGADQVWQEFGTRGEGIVVATIDSGVRYTHAALINQYRGRQIDGSFDHNYHWWDAINGSAEPTFDHAHGTPTMGLIVGDGGAGHKIGVAPEAKWITAKAFGGGADFESFASAAEWILAPWDLSGDRATADPSKRPHIVNNSWGWGNGSGDDWFMQYVDAWRAAGIFPAFAVMNRGPACGSTYPPGEYSQSFATGSTDINNVIAPDSGRGPSPFGGGIKPDISAPGHNVRSTRNTGDHDYWTVRGTSMASPHTAGVVALMWSANPTLIGNLDDTEAILRNTAIGISDAQCGDAGPPNNVYGWGLLNAYQAVAGAIRADIVVNSAADPGDGVCDAFECTLREALDVANGRAGADKIVFNIFGPGPHTIKPTTALPTITDSVIIDGYTQPGAVPNSNPITQSLNATLMIELDGSSAGSDANGLRVTASRSTIRGLAINRFARNGIEIEMGEDNVLEGNFIGIDLTGSIAKGNRSQGIEFIASSRNKIGGRAAAARNIISGNGGNGVYIRNQSDANVIQGNLVGTNRAGTDALPNGFRGIEISESADNLIGGTLEEERNIVSGNLLIGILFRGPSATGNLVHGNFIGTDVTGTEPLGNGGSGVAFTFHTVGNQIGGIEAGMGNTIAFNGSRGVHVSFFDTNHAIQANSIFQNSGIGIDLSPVNMVNEGFTANDPGDVDVGGNNLQNFPRLKSVRSVEGETIVEGRLNSIPNSVYDIEFFANSVCDKTNRGEGELFVGTVNVTTDARGRADFAFRFPNNGRYPFMTATATSASGDTSEFSACVEIERPLLYLSSSSSGMIDTISFADEDILVYDTLTEEWILLFDGSDVGLGGADINAFTVLENGHILLSLNVGHSIPHYGLVDDSDIVEFAPTSLGQNTAGAFTLYFDGSDVGLTEKGEDISAISFIEDGNLVISTLGVVDVPGLRAQDEDMLLFETAELGETTTGTWSHYLDGSDIGLNKGNEDLWGAWVNQKENTILLTTNVDFVVGSIRGTAADIFACAPIEVGADSDCNAQMFWRGAEHGFGDERIDGFAVGTRLSPLFDETSVITRHAQHTENGEQTHDDHIDDDVEESMEHFYLPLMAR
ncbi:S8 family serine peptidase [Chloroflexi bacterium TSY]|nr:S8 family serine peptidase [Chloroflexi bacterium TSY]